MAFGSRSEQDCAKIKGLEDFFFTDLSFFLTLLLLFKVDFGP